MKHFFKNNRGMTYVELLVAFTLLVLVITVFSPMLLSSYNTLYNAGEKNVDTYNAKSAIEDGLAYRNSADILYNIQANFNGLGEMAKVNMRRVTESAAQGVASAYNNLLSSLYYNGKGYIRLISSTHINDDANCKTFVFQVSGFQINNVVYTGSPSRVEKTDSATGKKYYEYTVKINVFAPVKTPQAKTGGGTQALEDTVYQTPINASEVNLDTSALNSGIIRVTVKGVDITQSPLKLVLQYYDENNEFQEISTYIYIETPSIILGGETGSGAEYYTSAGLVTTKSRSKDASGNEIEQIERSLDIDGRDMKNVTYPTGTVIKNISWIDNDTTSQSGGFKKYYVLTGTNGAIYRLYSATDGTSYNKMKDTFKITNGEEPYSITDGGLKRTIYPVAWGGDYTHQFAYSIYKEGNKESSDYGSSGENGANDRKNDRSWLTESTSRGIGQDGVYGTNAQYSFYYNGRDLTFTFRIQRQRTIGYILTETGHALRAYGVKVNSPTISNGVITNPGDYTGYQSVWETHDVSTGAWNGENTWAQEIYYFSGSGNDGEQYKAESFASPSIVAYTSKDFAAIKRDGDGRSKENYIGTADATKGVTITSAVYIPQLDKVLYLGTVNSYVILNQTDNVYEPEDGFCSYYAKDCKCKGVDRLWFVEGTANGTKIYKVVGTREDSSRDTHINNFVTKATTTTTSRDDINKFFLDRSASSTYTNPQGINISDTAVTFGYSSNREFVYSKITFDGVNEYYKSYEPYYFLSHYGSTINGSGISSHSPNYCTVRESYVKTKDYKHNLVKVTEKGMWTSYFSFDYPENCNTYNNDYYNAWMPGEYYNLTTTATKEGVTVAVGYATAASTYQYINPDYIHNTSTAFGGIYNDGVLAVSIDGVTSSMQNLLYFKDNDTFDATSITSSNGIPGINKQYYIDTYKNHANSAMPNGTKGNERINQDQYVFQDCYNFNNAWAAGTSFYNTTYGTHSRQSIQFTAVDLLVEGGADDGTELAEGQSDTKTYIAFYGDNTGRVFKSSVATATAAGSLTGSTVQAVSYIADLTNSNAASAPSRMEEIKLDNGNSISTVFSKITNIVCDGSTVIISGTRNASSTSTKSCVVVGKKSADGTWKWKSLAIASSSHIINDAAVSEGIYYACGEVGSNGFFMAVDLMDINAAIDDNTADITSHTLIKEKMRTPATNIGESATTTLPKLYSIDCKGSGTD